MSQLEAFAAVMRLGTATAAANVLNSSQPSVTRAIRQLEDATRLPLFDRRGGRLRPTTEAEALLETVEASFAGLGAVAEAAETIRRRRLGSVRVGCLPALAQGFMARVFAAFVRKQPEISLSLRPLTARPLVEAVRQREVDLAVIAFTVSDVPMPTRRFTDIDEIALVPTGHRLARQRVITLKDLDGERLVQIDSGDPYRRRIEGLMRQAGVFGTHNIETQTSHGVGAMVAAGLGIGFVNPITALDFSGPRVAMVPIAARLPFETTLVAPQGKRAGPAIAAFIEALEAERDRSLDAAAAMLSR